MNFCERMNMNQVGRIVSYQKTLTIRYCIGYDRHTWEVLRIVKNLLHPEYP